MRRPQLLRRSRFLPQPRSGGTWAQLAVSRSSHLSGPDLTTTLIYAVWRWLLLMQRSTSYRVRDIHPPQGRSAAVSLWSVLTLDPTPNYLCLPALSKAKNKFFASPTEFRSAIWVSGLTELGSPFALEHQSHIATSGHHSIYPLRGSQSSLFIMLYLSDEPLSICTYARNTKKKNASLVTWSLLVEK